MEPKTWREANEIDPVSGYIKEDPVVEDMIEEEPEAEGFDMSSKFEEPSRAKFSQLLTNQSSYYDAWKIFKDMYNSDPEVIVDGGIPFGAGAFEGWWTGSSGYGRHIDDAFPSPHKQITGQDIKNLAKDEPEEVFSFLSNMFYNHSIDTGLTEDALEEIVRQAVAFRNLDYGEYLSEILDGSMNGDRQLPPGRMVAQGIEGIKQKWAELSQKNKRRELETFQPQEKRKRWHEANLKDEEETEGDVSSFEEPQFLNKVAGGIGGAASYVEALKRLDAAYENRELWDEETDEIYVPTGNGAFESWWTGSSQDPDILVPSPQRRITLQDIRTLEETDPDSLSSLFFNVFYNGSISRGFDADAFEALVRWAVSGADPNGEDNQDLVEAGIPQTRKNRSGSLEGIDANGIIQKALEEFFSEDGEDELLEAARGGNKKAQAYLIETALREYRFEESDIDIDPESGYITEKPYYTNPVSGYISTDSPAKNIGIEDNEEEEQGDVSNYPEPAAPPAVLEILKAPNYVTALQIFDEEFNEINTRAMTLIPYGSGAFEAWWCGKDPDPERFPDAVGSPHKKITREDVRKLLRTRDGWGPTGGPAISLFSNIFYNGSIAKGGIDEDVLEYLLEEVIQIGYDSDELAEDGEVSGAISTCINVEEAKEIMDAEEDITPFVKKEVREFLRNRA